MAESSSYLYPSSAVVVASYDEHSGHPFALTHPEPWTDRNEQVHTPNALQKVIGQHWEEDWTRVGQLRRGARLIIVRGGDSVEGIHHGTTQLDTARRDEQEAINLRCWKRALELAKFRHGRDQLLGVTGTVDHVGPAGESDERILRALLHTSEADGRYTRERLRFSVNGVSIEAWHKGPRPGGRDWTRPNAILATLRNYMYRNLKRGHPPTRYYFWGHWHVFTPVALQDDDGQIVSEGFVMPAWKVKDEYVYTVDPEGLAHVGLFILSIDRNGRSSWECPRISIEQDKMMEL